MRKFTKRSAIITTTAVVAIGAGAAAWAFTGWNVEGKGSGSADASKIEKLEAKATVKENVYPGLTTVISMDVQNPNEFPVQLAKAGKPLAVDAVIGQPPADECARALTSAANSTEF